MKDASTNYEDKRLTIRQLDWRYYKKETLPKVDLIVASDIVFARELHDSLSSLLVDLLSVSTEKEPSAYIACTVRADGMVKGFLQVRFFNPIPLNIKIQPKALTGDNIGTCLHLTM